MAELSSGMQTALAGPRVCLFGAVEIAFPAYTLRLLDGSGELMIGGHKYVGRDATYGVLDTFKGVADVIDDRAPAVTLGLIPASDAAMSALVDPGVQGSEVTIMVGVVNIDTGIVVPDPYMVFVGQIDVPTLTWDEHDRRLEYRIVAEAEQLFMIEEGRRLSDSFHQFVWPGETGLGLVTGIESTIAWGQKTATNIEVRSNLPEFASTFART